MSGLTVGVRNLEARRCAGRGCNSGEERVDRGAERRHMQGRFQQLLSNKRLVYPFLKQVELPEHQHVHRFLIACLCRVAVHRLKGFAVSLE